MISASPHLSVTDWRLRASHLPLHPPTPTLGPTPTQEYSEHTWSRCTKTLPGRQLPGLSPTRFSLLGGYTWRVSFLMLPPWGVYVQHFFLVDFTKFFHRHIFFSYNDKRMYIILYLAFLSDLYHKVIFN